MDKLDLLIKSLDNELSPQEQQMLEQALSESEALRRERDQLLAMRSALGELPPVHDPAFSERVMQRLHEKSITSTALIAAMFPRVAAACILVLFAFLLSIYVSEGSLTSDALLGTQELTVDEAYSLAAEEVDVQ